MPKGTKSSCSWAAENMQQPLLIGPTWQTCSVSHTQPVRLMTVSGIRKAWAELHLRILLEGDHIKLGRCPPSELVTFLCRLHITFPSTASFCWQGYANTWPTLCSNAFGCLRINDNSWHLKPWAGKDPEHSLGLGTKQDARTAKLFCCF